MIVTTLSPIQQKLVDLLRHHGSYLIRYGCGCWAPAGTTESVALLLGADLRTVRALERKNVLERVRQDNRETHDARRLVSMKDRFLAQIRAEGHGDDVLSYAEVKAIAAGNQPIQIEDE